MFTTRALKVSTSPRALLAVMDLPILRLLVVLALTGNVQSQFDFPLSLNVIGMMFLMLSKSSFLWLRSAYGSTQVYECFRNLFGLLVSNYNVAADCGVFSQDSYTRQGIRLSFSWLEEPTHAWPKSGSIIIAMQ